jgi:division protein CdvB (Snf7/Vps24/ESCRT-III family)
MASADAKKDKAIQAVRDLFNDESVSQSTTKELLEQVAEEIDVLVSAIEEDDEDDED